MTDARDDADWLQLVEDIRIEIARDLRIDERRVRLHIDELSPHLHVKLRIDGRMPTDREKRVVSAFFASVGIRTVERSKA